MASALLSVIEAQQAALREGDRQAQETSAQRAAEADRNRGFAGDVGTALKAGALRLPSAVTGLLDIPVAAVTGRPMVSEGWDAIGNLTGLDFDTWADEAARREYSDQYRQGAQAFQNAEGFADSALALLSNPGYAAAMGVESIPGMALGGAYARALKGAAGMSGLARVGAGEGAVMGGQAMGDLTEQGVDPRLAALAATGIGTGGALLGMSGGALARRLGLSDVDLLMAGQGRTVAEAAGNPGMRAALGRAGRRVAGGVVAEGLLEEAPQSALETVVGNLAQGNEWDQDLGKNVAAGTVVGGMMGGAVNVVPPARPRNLINNTQPSGQPDPNAPRLEYNPEEYDLNRARERYTAMAEMAAAESGRNPERAAYFTNEMAKLQREAEANGVKLNQLSQAAARRDLERNQKRADKLRAELEKQLVGDPDQATGTLRKLEDLQNEQMQLEGFLYNGRVIPAQAPAQPAAEPTELTRAAQETTAPDPAAVPVIRARMSVLTSQAAQEAEQGNYTTARELAEQAKAAKDQLVALGVKPSQMTTKAAEARAKAIDTEMGKLQRKALSQVEANPEAATQTFDKLRSLRAERAELAPLLPAVPEVMAVTPEEQELLPPTETLQTAEAAEPVAQEQAAPAFDGDALVGDVAALRARLNLHHERLEGEKTKRADTRLAPMLAKAKNREELLRLIEDKAESTGSPTSLTLLGRLYEDLTGQPLEVEPTGARKSTRADAAEAFISDAIDNGTLDNYFDRDGQLMFSEMAKAMGATSKEEITKQRKALHAAMPIVRRRKIAELGFTPAADGSFTPEQEAEAFRVLAQRAAAQRPAGAEPEPVETVEDYMDISEGVDEGDLATNNLTVVQSAGDSQTGVRQGADKQARAEAARAGVADQLDALNERLVAEEAAARDLDADAQAQLEARLAQDAELQSWLERNEAEGTAPTRAFFNGLQSEVEFDALPVTYRYALVLSAVDLAMGRMTPQQLRAQALEIVNDYKARNANPEPTDGAGSEPGVEPGRTEDQGDAGTRGNDTDANAGTADETDGSVGRTGRTPTITIKPRRRPIRRQEGGQAVVDLTEAEAVAAGLEGKTILEGLEWAAENAPTEDQRLLASRLANRLAELEMEGVSVGPLTIVNDDAEVDAETAAVLSTAFGATGIDDNSIFLNGPGRSAPGTTFETFLHEAAHVATQGAIEYGMDNPDSDAGKLVSSLLDAFEATTDYLKQKADGQSLTETEQFLVNRTNMMDDLHELVAWALTNRDAQRVLNDVPMRMGLVRTAWSRLVRAIGEFLGLTPRQDSALATVLQAADELLDTEPQSTAASSFRMHSVSPAASNANQLIQNDRVQEVNTHLKGWFRDAMTKVTNLGIFTSDLVAVAERAGLPSARTLDMAQRRKATRMLEIQMDVESVLSRYGEVDQRYHKEINELIYDMTTQGKWAFQPEWIDGEVELDPAMVRRYNRLGDDTGKAQQVVRDLFEHGYRTHEAKVRATQLLVDKEYEGLMAAAKSDAARAEIQEKWDAARRESSAHLTKLQGPYAPLKRFGDYVVVGRSAEYKRRLNEGESVADLVSDPDHYYVEFVQSGREALARRAELAAETGLDVWAGAKEAVFDETELPFEAIQRLRELFKADETFDKNKKAKAVIDRLLVDMYLGSLNQSNARHAEQKRNNVAGASQEMIRAFAQQGRADSALLSSMEFTQPILEALESVKSEAKEPTGNPEQDLKKTEIRNELLKRHYMSLDYRATPVQDKMMAATSFWMLLTTPSYYLQNLTQSWIISLPVMAGRFNSYPRAARALTQGTQDAARVLKETSWQEAADLDQFDGPQDEKEMLLELQRRGTLDFGISQELGYWEGTSQVAKALDKVQRFFGMGVRKVEVINRMGTALAVYRLAKEQGVARPTELADQLVIETHGDYSSQNAPRVLRMLPKVMVQFRKFQFIQFSVMARTIHQALKGESQQERDMARAAFGYLMLNHGIAGGVLGVPAAHLAAYAYSAFAGDDDDPADFEVNVRRALGEENKALADLLLRGVPAALGVDVSERVGAGRMLDPLPFVEYEASREGYTTAVAAAMGPFLGGLAVQFADGIDRIGTGLSKENDREVIEGIAQLQPRFIRDAIRAFALAQDGKRLRDGSLTLSPEDVSMFDAVMQGMGLPTTTVTRQQMATGKVIKYEQFYRDRTSTLKARYAAAVADQDTRAQREVRQEWLDLQEARAENGFAKQPISDLLKAPRELRRRREKVESRGIRSSEAGADFATSLL